MSKASVASEIRESHHNIQAYIFLSQRSTISGLDEVMTSTTSSSVQHLVDGLKKDGFVYMKDVLKGLQADEFARKHFPMTTIEGVNFCKVHTFDDPVSERHRLLSATLLTY